MSRIKFSLVIILLLNYLTAFAQNNNSVFMKWKIKPGENLVYKTIMANDTNHSAISINGFFKMAGKDSTFIKGKSNNFFNEMMKALGGENYVTYLTEKKEHIIDIEGRYDNKDSLAADTAKHLTDYKNFQSLLKQFAGSAMFRGEISEDGTITSFYISDGQKKLITLFFTLPGKAVKVGDMWSLDVHLTSVDQNFYCDSAYRKNEVRVVNISNIASEHIVTLDYNIIEYVHGSYTIPVFGIGKQEAYSKITFKATANFSIEKGRWLDYNGVMSDDTHGFLMSTQSTKKYALIPLLLK